MFWVRHSQKVRWHVIGTGNLNPKYYDSKLGQEPAPTRREHDLETLATINENPTIYNSARRILYFCSSISNKKMSIKTDSKLMYRPFLCGHVIATIILIFYPKPLMCGGKKVVIRSLFQTAISFASIDRVP